MLNSQVSAAPQILKYSHLAEIRQVISKGRETLLISTSNSSVSLISFLVVLLYYWNHILWQQSLLSKVQHSMYLISNKHCPLKI